jgi:hypothetical protein
VSSLAVDLTSVLQQLVSLLALLIPMLVQVAMLALIIRIALSPLALVKRG